MTRPRLIPHAGLHKTGTTALQNAFNAQRATLAARGVIYPEIAAASGKRHRNHFLLSHAVAGIAPFDLDAFVESLLRLPADRTVLLSAEAVCRHYDGAPQHPGFGPGHWRAGGDGPAYWARRRTYLERLRGVLGAFDVIPVLVLRRQDRIAESLYFTCVFSQGIPDPFDDFLVGRRHWFDFDRQVALFREVFGQVHTIAYEEALADGIAETFLKRVLGIELAGLETPRTRVSTDPRTVLWMRKRNAAAGASLRDWRRRAFGFADWLGARAPFADHPRVGFWFSQQARDRFLAAYGVETADPVPPQARLDPQTEARITALFEEWERSKA